MSIHQITRAFSAKKIKTIKIFTTNRIYEGELSDYPDGTKGVTTESIHMNNITVYSILEQKVATYETITILAGAIESFTV